MNQRPPGDRDSESAANILARLEKLEGRVLELVDELQEARAARRRAEAEADELRNAVRARVQALVHRVSELEREA